MPLAIVHPNACTARLEPPRRRARHPRLPWLVATAVLLASPLAAHEGHEHVPIGSWFFWPDYTLEGRAANHPGPREPEPRTPFDWIDIDTPPLRLFGEVPTDRRARLIDANRIPTHTFSLELWLVDHVNQPVSALVTARGRRPEDPPAWAVTYRQGEVRFLVRSGAMDEPVVLEAPKAPAFKKYWRHVIASYDGDRVRLYLNGELALEEVAGGTLSMPREPEFEIAAYLAREPYMTLPNLVREVRLYDDDIGPTQARERFQAVSRLVEEGRILADRFHFNAGPALTFMSRTNAHLTWETDRPARAVVRYGTRLPWDRTLNLPETRPIQHAVLPGLTAETAYFYQVTAIDERGEEIESGPLTFKTAVGEDSPYGFAIIGDTEARPHVNDRIAKAIWGERPDFILNVGDLTDGGQEHHKFEWNLEYFLGMNQVLGRIPLFPVPGNGESDLHWYRRYHGMPQPADRYTFRYGNAEFFMLDSNRPMGPGSEQHAWLEERLRASTARWKFACHHHPVYSSDEDDYGNTWRGPSALGDANPRGAVALYERYGVDIVFYGHIHAYERTWPMLDGQVQTQHGVRYVQTGGAGGNLENFTPTRNAFSNKLFRGHHYCLIRIHQDHLTFQMFDTDGRLRDAFDLRK